MKKKPLGRPKMTDPRGNRHTFRLNSNEQTKFETDLSKSKIKDKSEYIRKKVLK